MHHLSPLIVNGSIKGVQLLVAHGVPEQPHQPTGSRRHPPGTEHAHHPLGHAPPIVDGAGPPLLQLPTAVHDPAYQPLVEFSPIALDQGQIVGVILDTVSMFMELVVVVHQVNALLAQPLQAIP